MCHIMQESYICSAQETEAREAVGHMGYMSLMNQIRGGICPSFKYATNEKSMFLPLTKKALNGGIVGRRQN